MEQAHEACREEDAFVWIGLHEPSEDEFDSIRREFELHELAVEDAINAHQRPKLEVYGDTIFIVLKTARYVDSEEVVEFGEILIFLGDGFIITVRHGEASGLKQVRETLEHDRELLRHGPGAVLHAIVDQRRGRLRAGDRGAGRRTSRRSRTRSSRRRAATRPSASTSSSARCSSSTAPPRRWWSPSTGWPSGQYELIHPEVRAYFRDVNDHLVRVNEQLDGFRELLTSVLQANLAQVTVRQNDDVRKISAIVAILAVPTMIAGIYGMNFEHMPELNWSSATRSCSAVMAVICLGLYRYFKRSGWL